MRVTQQLIWRQIVVAAGLNLSVNAKLALHQFLHPYVVPMEK
jgi:hypothetical protein